MWGLHNRSMKTIPMLISMMVLSGCSCVGCDEWANLDYTLAECGTKNAILTTTGCQKNPAMTTHAGQVKAVSNVDNVDNVHNDASHTQENQAMKR